MNLNFKLFPDYDCIEIYNDSTYLGILRREKNRLFWEGFADIAILEYLIKNSQDFHKFFDEFDILRSGVKSK